MARFNRQPLVLERLLGYPVFNRLLATLLRRPRVLQVCVAGLGVVLVALALRPLVLPGPVPATATPVEMSPAAGTSIQPSSDDAAVLAVVAAYNQASITAAVRNTTEPMAPLLTTDGSAWAAVQVEYTRRAARGETHVPALTRWGVLTITVQGDTATVETQEQWDDITSVGGQVIASRRGILTRNRYILQRSLITGWQITTVTSTTLIG